MAAAIVAVDHHSLFSPGGYDPPENEVAAAAEKPSLPRWGMSVFPGLTGPRLVVRFEC